LLHFASQHEWGFLGRGFNDQEPEIIHQKVTLWLPDLENLKRNDTCEANTEDFSVWLWG